MSIHRGYKVLYPIDSKLVSCVPYHNVICEVGRVVEYKFNAWVTPHNGCGPLAVFNSLYNATVFKNMNELAHCTIYECEYVPSKFMSMWYTRHDGVIVPYAEFLDFPKGTKLSDSVKITCATLNPKGSIWKRIKKIIAVLK